MKKVLLKAVMGLSVLAIPSSLWATPPAIKVQAGIQPTAVEACIGATEPSNMTVITFVNHTWNTVTITNAQLPGITTPTPIAPGGTVTFQIPAMQQGVYIYTLDGCH